MPPIIERPVKFYVEQSPAFALGKFINITPAIREVYNYTERPVPVFFHTEYVKQCFRDCPFIEIIDKPVGYRFFGSEMINWAIPDWRFSHKKILEALQTDREDIPHTYVDYCDRTKDENYTVFLRGCGTTDPKKVAEKDPGEEIYFKMMDQLPGNKVFVGSAEDRERFSSMPITCEVGDIREALRLISRCSRVICNDTGLYHAAGAMKKSCFALWKNTRLSKNRNRFDDVKYSRNWQEDFNEWTNRHSADLLRKA